MVRAMGIKVWRAEERGVTVGTLGAELEALERAALLRRKRKVVVDAKQIVVARRRPPRVRQEVRT